MELKFEVNGYSVDRVEITPLTFVKFAEYATQARNGGGKFEVNLRRLRLMNSVRYADGDKTIQLTPVEVNQLPIPVARKLIKALDESDANHTGKIIREGDGISTAIGWELAEPIAISGKEPLREIEFIAHTYGDIEEVFAQVDPLEQTMALLRTVAKPVYSGLVAMPSWAIDRISLADGVLISQQILPRFLGDSEKSD